MKVHHCDACKKALGKREFRVKLWAKAKEGYKMKIVRLEICSDCYSALPAIARRLHEDTNPVKGGLING